MKLLSFNNRFFLRGWFHLLKGHKWFQPDIFQFHTNECYLSVSETSSPFGTMCLLSKTERNVVVLLYFLLKEENKGTRSTAAVCFWAFSLTTRYLAGSLALSPSTIQLMTMGDCWDDGVDATEQSCSGGDVTTNDMDVNGYQRLPNWETDCTDTSPLRMAKAEF